ncbi:MAG: protein FilE, partial [Acinetobacter calcoaceticus]
MSRSRLAIATFFVAIAVNSAVYADGFYTIIGPDGRPMIVPSKRVEQVVDSPSKVLARPDVKVNHSEEMVLPEATQKLTPLSKTVSKLSNTA